MKKHESKLKIVPAVKSYEEGFAEGVEAAIHLLEKHCCVSTCCDVQPSSGESQALANCLRKTIEWRKNHGI